MPTEDGLTLAKGGDTDVALALVSATDRIFRVLTDGDGLSVTKDGAAIGFPYRRRIVAKTAAYTCRAEDSGTLFTTTGAGAGVTFTLPAVATSSGLWYEFVNTANFDMTVAAPAGTLVVHNNAAADSVAFVTVNEKIGGYVRVFCDGAKWIAMLGTSDNGTTVLSATVT